VRRLSLRFRLALLIGLLLAAAGVALLSISYGLVSSNLKAPLAITSPAGHTVPHSQARIHGVGSSASPGAAPPGGVAPTGAHNVNVAVGTQDALAKRTLDQLLKQYLVVLAGLVLVAVACGWLLADRLLRRVRRITVVAQQVTPGNLDQRIRLHGPRDELRELGDTFDGMLARLDGVFSAQRRFVADASHELRTPLATMRAELEVLAADPDAALADLEVATVVLRRQLDRGEHLIEALLALARSEPELLAVEPVDLAGIAREVLDDVAGEADAHHLSIDVQIASAVVEGDRRLLTLLVCNLVGNAVKHNHVGGWIALSTYVEANVALLEVANSGHVVAADEVQELTQAFRRGGRARVGDGHGLGLAIVQAVTRAHRGTVTIEPRREGGLRAEVRLPLAPTPPANGLATTSVCCS
jgi:signal transduction histidine kinase